MKEELTEQEIRVDLEILRQALDIFIPGYKSSNSPYGTRMGCSLDETRMGWSLDETTIWGEFCSILALYVCLFVRN